MKDIVLKDLLSLIPFNTEIFVMKYRAAVFVGDVNKYKTDSNMRKYDNIPVERIDARDGKKMVIDIHIED